MYIMHDSKYDAGDKIYFIDAVLGNVSQGIIKSLILELPEHKVTYNVIYFNAELMKPVSRPLHEDELSRSPEEIFRKYNERYEFDIEKIGAQIQALTESVKNAQTF